jgi:methylthioribose-1-phosphate isomerase
MAASLRSLIYTPASASDPASLQVLDQLKLPQDKVYISVPDIATTYNVIRNMQIRGKLVNATLQWYGAA